MHRRNNTAARFARRRWRVLVSRATLYVTEKYHFPDIQRGGTILIVYTQVSTAGAIDRETLTLLCAMPAGEGEGERPTIDAHWER